MSRFTTHTSLLTTLCCLIAVSACQPAAPSQPPAPSATPSAAPTYAPDGPVSFSPLEGYSVDPEHQLIASRPSADDKQIDLVKVFKTQADFDAYVRVSPDNPDRKVTPAPIDFAKTWVLVTAKATFYYGYHLQLTSLKMEQGNLRAEAKASITRTENPQLEDYIRPEYSLYRIAPVAFKELSLKITATESRTIPSNPATPASPIP